MLASRYTAIPLGIAFYRCRARGERLAGVAVVLAILISGLVALGQTIERFIHPHREFGQLKTSTALRRFAFAFLSVSSFTPTS
jgi:hypothetical protein